MMKIFFLLMVLLSCNKKVSHEFTYAVTGNFRPFSYQDKLGALKGYDVEVGKLVAHQLGMKPKAVQVKFPQVISQLQQNHFMAAVTSHTITEERQKLVDFSLPYYFSGPQVFSRMKTDHLDLKNKEIAVSVASIYKDMAAKYTNHLVLYYKDDEALKALSNGRHDAVITDALTGAMEKKKSKIQIYSNQKLGRSDQAIMVRKGDRELLDKINQAILELRKTGALKRMGMKFFGRDISDPAIDR